MKYCVCTGELFSPTHSFCPHFNEQGCGYNCILERKFKVPIQENLEGVKIKDRKYIFFKGISPNKDRKEKHTVLKFTLHFFSRKMCINVT